MGKILQTISFILAFGFSVVAQSSVDRAMELYQAGDYERAYSLFESYAAIGNNGAQFNIGVMYYKGQLLEKDWAKAYAWMALAGMSGGEDLHISLANKLFAKFSNEKKVRATNELDILKRKYGGDAIASFIEPVLLDDADCSYGVEKLNYKAPKYPKSQLNAGRLGTVIFEYTIAVDGSVRDVQIVSSTNNSFTKSAMKSLKTFRYKPPVIGGVVTPIYNHRNVFTYVINGAEGNYEKVAGILDGLKAKAESGDRIYQYHYAKQIDVARHYSSHLKGFDYSDKDSNEWFYKAAEAGVIEAQYKIGRNQYYGQGCYENKEAGMRWLLKSASGGYAEAQYLMALEFLKDSDLVYHEDESVMWLEEAAGNNFGPAQVKLAWIYATAEEERFYAPEKALGLMEQDIDGYYDDVFIYEVRAASYAANGKYKKAVKYQKKAISEAEDFDRDLNDLEERLAVYELGKVWRQSVHRL